LSVLLFLIVRMRTAVFVAVVAVCVACTVAQSCQYDVNGAKIDLSKLSHVYGDRETIYKKLSDGSNLYVNPCERTTVQCSESTSVCMLTPDFNYVSRGETDSMKVEDLKCKDYGDTGVTATFTGADSCGSSKYTTKVHFVCGNSAKPEVVSAKGTAESCELEMVVKTNAVCSAATTLLPSLVFVLLALLAVAFA